VNTVIFLNTTESGTAREALKSTKELGYKVVVLTENIKHIQQVKRFQEVNELVYINQITFESAKFYIDEYILENNLSAILSFTDGYVAIASRLADQFTPNILNSKALEIMEDKLKTRIFFKDENFTPNFSSVENLLEKDNLTYPIIHKEKNSTGSKGVRRIDSPVELSNLDSMDSFVEEFINGEQYLVELLVIDRSPHVIAKIKQDVFKSEYDTYIINGYSLDKDSKMNSSEKHMIDTIVSKLDIRNAHIHIEYRIKDNEAKLIEINPRISGSGMYALLETALEKNYVTELLKFYLGHKIEVPKIKHSCFSRYFISDRNGVLSKVTGTAAALGTEGAKKVYIKPKQGQNIRCSESMGDRYGYVIGTGETPQEAKVKTMEAAKKIKFHVIKKRNLELILFIILVIILSAQFNNM